MLSCNAQLVEIQEPDGSVVRGDLYVPSSGVAGIVFLCHGFKGHKRWGFLPHLALRLCETRLAAFVVDFSFNGTFPSLTGDERPAQASTPAHELDPADGAGRRLATPRGSDPVVPVTPRPSAFSTGEAPQRPNLDLAAPGTYIRPDLFRANTLMREFNDLRFVLGRVRENGLGGRVARTTPAGLFGHSRGGVSVMLNALDDESISALCTWSMPDHPDHFTPAQKARWRRAGEYAFTDARDGARLSLSVDYLDDLEENHEFYDLRRRAADLRVPHLIVHGTSDLAVGVECARSLHEAESALDDKRLVIVRGGHTFGVKDAPDAGLRTAPPPLVEACVATVQWFDTHLAKGTRR